MDVARVPQQAHPDLARVGSAACSSVPSRSTWRLRPDANMAMARARASIRATIDASAIASEKVFEPAWLPLEGLLGCGGYPSLAATLAPSAHCARHVPAAEHAAMHYGLLGGALRVGQVVVLLGCVATACVAGAAIGAGIAAVVVTMKCMIVTSLSLSSPNEAFEFPERLLHAWAHDTVAGLQAGGLLGLWLASSICTLAFVPLDAGLGVARHVMHTGKRVTLLGAHACGMAIGCCIGLPLGVLVGLWTFVDSMARPGPAPS